jgi:hypothetical protein
LGSKSAVKRCERCEKLGHSAAKCLVPANQCPNLKGILANLSQKKKKKNGGNGNSVNAWSVWHAIDANLGQVDKWYFDTGAAGHICCDVSMMYDVKPHKGVVRGVGGEAPVKFIGSVDLEAVLPDGTTEVITLRRVLCVPSLDVNLVEMNVLSNDQIEALMVLG